MRTAWKVWKERMPRRQYLKRVCASDRVVKFMRVGQARWVIGKRRVDLCYGYASDCDILRSCVLYQSRCSWTLDTVVLFSGINAARTSSMCPCCLLGGECAFRIASR